MTITPWPPDPLAPREQFHEECWQLAGVTGKPVACTITQLASGHFETRVYRSEDILETRLAGNLSRAREFAAALREELIVKGFTSAGKES